MSDNDATVAGETSTRHAEPGAGTTAPSGGWTHPRAEAWSTETVSGVQQRLSRLLATNRSIVGELSLPRVLQRIVDCARDIAGAQHGALGVLGADGHIEKLVRSGPDQLSVAGLQDFAHSSGVSDAHPRRGRFLSVPISAHGSVFGRLYLTDPVADGGFSTEDEELVAALAATAGIAIENARLYEDSRRRQEWLLASSEVSQRLLAAEDDEVGVLRLIAVYVEQLAEAAMVCIVVRSEDDPSQLRVAAAAGEGERELQDVRYAAEGSLADAAMREGRSRVVDAGQHHNRHWILNPDSVAGPLLTLPLKGEGGARGAVIVARHAQQPTFTAVDVTMAEDFATKAAIALELAAARGTQRRLEALQDRERIARDLHDRVIQRLFAAGLGLQSTAGAVDDPVLRGRLTRTVDDLDDTIRQIRSAIFGLREGRCPEESVRSAVLRAVDEVSASLGFRPSTHLLGPLDTLVDHDLAVDAAAVVRHAVTNLGREAQARRVQVRVQIGGHRLHVVVTDDGPGTEDGRRGDLGDLRQRVESRGGEMTAGRLDPGRFRVRWSVPLP